MTSEEYKKAMKCLEPDPFFRARAAAAVEAGGRPRLRRPLRTAVIAAAACLALMGTALAASPGLREMLAASLGGFAPYAKEQVDQAYVVNEFEYQVLSAVTDGTTIQVYVQQRDLVEGRNCTEELCGFLAVKGGGYGAKAVRRCVGVDEGTGTSLWCLNGWGQIAEESGNVVLSVSGVMREAFPEEGVHGTDIPLEVKLMPSKVIAAGAETKDRGEEIRLSPLGLTVVSRSDPGQYHSDWVLPVRVCLLDGTEVRPENENGTSAQATIGRWEEPDSLRKLLIWNFREPLELDQVAGVYIRNDYYPVQ